jgi:hypothetical protein
VVELDQLETFGTLTVTRLADVVTLDAVSMADWDLDVARDDEFDDDEFDDSSTRSTPPPRRPCEPTAAVPASPARAPPAAPCSPS